MGKKIKVVFDTNVWVSIFMDKILRKQFLQTKQELTVYVSTDIILEISKAILYPRIAQRLKKADVSEREILRIIETNSKRIIPKLKLNTLKEDANDNKTIECALVSKADIIVSGDKHLLKLCKFRKTRILTLREFFDSIQEIS